MSVCMLDKHVNAKVNAIAEIFDSAEIDQIVGIICNEEMRPYESTLIVVGLWHSSHRHQTLHRH